MTEVELLPGARLALLPERAAFDAALRCLFVADAHIGKAVSFRRLGVPVPGGTTAEALGRLDAALAATGATRIVFLGDLLHSARAKAPGTMEAVAAWRDRHAALALTLVRGNHDHSAGDPPTALGIEVVDGPLRLGPWSLQHEPPGRSQGRIAECEARSLPNQPEPAPGAYALAGHVHPCVVLGGRANDRLRLPCFHFGAGVGVLPAFGPFTGMHALPLAPGDRAFAIAEGRVIDCFNTLAP